MRPEITPAERDRFVSLARDRVDSRKLSKRRLSTKLGFSENYVTALLGRGFDRPDTDRILALAEELAIPVAEFAPDLAGVDPDSRRGFAIEVKAAPAPAPASGTVPLYAISGFGLSDFLTFNGVGAIPALPGASYGVEVPNGANSPRFEPGEKVFVSELGVPRQRDYVFLRMKDGTATIAWFDGFHDGKLCIGYLAGAEARSIPVDEVEAMHRIIGSALT